MRTLREYIKTLENGVYDLFDAETIASYPEPFNNIDIATLIASNAVRDYGKLILLKDVEESTLEEVKGFIKNGLLALQFTLAAYNRIMESTTADYEEIPERKEVRKYGEKKTTLNIGARSNSQTLGATSGSVTDTSTAYDTLTGKETNKSESQTSAVTNGSTSQEATDVNTETARTDTVEYYNNVDADEAPDIVAKWLKIAGAPLMLMYERAFVDILTAPIFD